MAVYKTDSGGYVISSREVWRPGVFEDERTAKYAFRFSDEVLHDLQDKANEEGTHVITYTMLKAIGVKNRKYDE